MISAISTALSGMTAASQKVADSAGRIANAGTSPAVSDSDLAQDIVDIKIAEFSFKANARVLETAKEMTEELGRVLDRTA